MFPTNVQFSFHEGLPEGLTFHFDAGIFHDPKHLILQSPEGWNTFYIRSDRFVEGIVHFNVREQDAKSPFRSPFGSFLFSDFINQATLHEFIGFCESRLKDKNVNVIHLKHQPELYAPEKNLDAEIALQAAGYKIQSAETSAIIPVTGKSFESGLHRSEKKRLRKCREAELKFEVLPSGQLQEIYTFLEACRAEKGYAVSMSFAEIEKLANAFPERVLLTAVSDKNQLVAANISIRVYENVLYNFYHDHSPDYDHVSPVVLLNEGLYQVCQQQKITLLDLGTSNPDGALSESLLNFKLHLGARPSRKLIFTKKIA